MMQGKVVKQERLSVPAAILMDINPMGSIGNEYPLVYLMSTGTCIITYLLV